MKLSTLLLSSAALVVAGSAFAADLPAKKAAPAAKPAATGCPAFGAGFFQIPGGDTCIKLSGYMAYEGNYNGTAGTYGQDGAFRLITDVRSNTDAGVVRGFARITGSYGNSSSGSSSGTDMTPSRAYVQLGGLTAGKNASLADISGTAGWNYGSNLGGGTGTGIWYAMNAGGATITIGEENAVSDNSNSGASSADLTSKRPDLLAKVSFAAGAATLDLVGVSHAPTDNYGGSPNTAGAAADGNGYAFLGRVGVTSGDFGAAIFGGTSRGALKYTSAVPSGYADYDSTTSTEYSSGSNIGGEITAKLGNGLLAIAAGQQKATDAAAGGSTKTTTIGVDYALNVAKGFVVEPEVIFNTGDSKSDVYYLTIHRDF